MPVNTRTRKQAAPAHASARVRPKQARSRERYRRMLAAAETELELHGLEGLSCHQVARRAGVPAASVYQYFPTKYALIFALAEDKFEYFSDQFTERLEQCRSRSWQTLMREMMKVAVGVHNSSAAMRLLTIGGQGSQEVRVLDKEINNFLAIELVAAFEARFGIAQSALLVRAVTLAIEMFDAVVAVSVRQTGRVDPFHAREATRAVLVYLEAFMKEQGIAPAAQHKRR